MPLQFRRSHNTRGGGASWNEHRQVHVETIWRAERIYIRQEASPCLVHWRGRLRSHFSCFADAYRVYGAGRRSFIANLKYSLTVLKGRLSVLETHLHNSLLLSQCFPLPAGQRHSTLDRLLQRFFPLSIQLRCFFALSGRSGLGGRGGGVILRARNVAIFLSTERKTFVNDEWCSMIPDGVHGESLPAR